MRGLLIAALVATGCGRLGFDRTASGDGGSDDAPPIDVVLANHDEDGDGVDDAIDKCPMVFDDQTDLDKDGVGAACDPDDASPTQHLLLFDPMLAVSPDLTFPTGTWTQGSDELVLSGTSFAEIDRVQAITDADIWIGFDIKAISGGTQQVITHPSVPSIPLRYYGQLYRTTGVNEATVLSYDDVTFTGLDSTPLGSQGVHPGELVTITRVRTSPPKLEYHASWGNEMYDVMAATPSYTGSPQVRVEVDGLVVGIRFMAVIVTN